MMRATLKSKPPRKEVDVEYIGEISKGRYYKDTHDGKVYPEDYLEFKEYYGG